MEEVSSEATTQTAAASPAEQSDKPPRHLFLVLVPAFAILNFLGVLAIPKGDFGETIFMPSLFGMVVGQAIFLAIWAALGPFRSTTQSRPAALDRCT